MVCCLVRLLSCKRDNNRFDTCSLKYFQYFCCVGSGISLLLACSSLDGYQLQDELAFANCIRPNKIFLVRSTPRKLSHQSIQIERLIHSQRNEDVG